MPQPVHVERFWQDGRGPELNAVHWGHRGSQLLAVDYSNPDNDGAPEGVKHVLFSKPQALMITPEEVIDYGQLGGLLAAHRPAAMFDLGRSAWLRSFSQRHLAACRHYQLLFYDELFDVLCEGVECCAGGYQSLRTG